MEMAGANLKLKYRSPKTRGSNPYKARVGVSRKTAGTPQGKVDPAVQRESSLNGQRIPALVGGRHLTTWTRAEYEEWAAQ